MRLQLPPEFLQCEEGKFAGGVERAFMSTTKSPEVAFVYASRASNAVFVCCAKGSRCVPAGLQRRRQDGGLAHGD